MATNISTSFTYVKSEKGTDKLSHDGCLYIFHRGTVKKEWRCDVRGCKARMHVVDGTIVKCTGEHYHAIEYGKAEVALLKEKLRKRGKESNDNPYVALGELTSSLSETAKSSHPTQHALKMMYKRQRTTPPNPISLEELQLNPEEIKTHSNRNFFVLRHWSWPEQDSFVSYQGEHRILTSIWLADGTFKTVPALFCQLYTVHCLVGGPNPFENGHLLPCYSQTRCNLHTLECGKLSVKHVQIRNHATYLWTLSKQQLIP